MQLNGKVVDAKTKQPLIRAMVEFWVVFERGRGNTIYTYKCTYTNMEGEYIFLDVDNKYGGLIESHAVGYASTKQLLSPTNKYMSVSIPLVALHDLGGHQ